MQIIENICQQTHLTGPPFVLVSVADRTGKSTSYFLVEKQNTAPQTHTHSFEPLLSYEMKELKSPLDCGN